MDFFLGLRWGYQHLLQIRSPDIFFFWRDLVLPRISHFQFQKPSIPNLQLFWFAHYFYRTQCDLDEGLIIQCNEFYDIV